MCLGKTHVLAGLAIGEATGLYALRMPPHTAAGLALITGACAPIPDLDQVGSCASGSLGILSSLLARGVRKISGGHRHGSHTAIAALVFAGLAWLGGYYRHDLAGRIGLALLLAIAFAGTARALAIPGHLDDLAAIAAAVGMAWTGWGLALVPLGTGLGVLAHLAADGMTDQGIPLLWPLMPMKRHIHLLPEPFSFTTGTRPERYIVTPALLAALAWLVLLATKTPLHEVHTHLAVRP